MKVDKRAVEEQRKYIRHHVPNPKKEAFVDLPISHEEYLKARFKTSHGKVGEMTGRFWMESEWSSFTDEVDLERTYVLLDGWDEDEEEAKENRKKKKERDDEIGRAHV